MCAADFKPGFKFVSVDNLAGFGDGTTFYYLVRAIGTGTNKGYFSAEKVYSNGTTLKPTGFCYSIANFVRVASFKRITALK